MRSKVILISILLIVGGFILLSTPAYAWSVYDDFSTLDNWYDYDAGVTVSNNVLIINSESAHLDTIYLNKNLWGAAQLNPPYTIRYKLYYSAPCVDPNFNFQIYGSYDKYQSFNPLSINEYSLATNGGTSTTLGVMSGNTWHDIKCNGYANGTGELFVDGESKAKRTLDADLAEESGSYIRFLSGNNVDAQIKDFYMSDALDSDYTAPDTVNFPYSNITINKNTGTYTPNIIRSNVVNATTTIQYYTEDDTAHAGVDYAQTSGTITFDDGSISELINSIQIYNVDPTVTRTFKLNINNVVNGTLGINTTINVTIMQTGTYAITVNPANVQLFTNATATLSINDPNYMYDDIQWFMNGIQIEEYKLSGSSQWQHWNGTAWVNCSNATVFTQSRYQDTAGEHAFQTFINYNNARIGFAEGDFTVTNNETQTIYYIRVVDSEGADLSTFNGHFFESEDPSKDYTFSESGYGPVLDMHRHFQGIVNATGYINGTIAFQTTLDRLNTSATQRTITITMVGSDEPSDSSKAYLDVKIIDSSTNVPIPDAIFVLAYASNGSSKSYNLYGTVKRVTVDKGTAYTYKASSSSYYAYTGSVTLNSGQGMLVIPLQPRPIATTVPTTPGSGGSGGTATYTPYTDTQRQNQAMTMIDQLLEAGPGLMQLVILAVFMGLIMMIFPNQSNGRKRYR